MNINDITNKPRDLREERRRRELLNELNPVCPSNKVELSKERNNILTVNAQSNSFTDSEIAEKVFALKKEKNKQESDALMFGEILLAKIEKESEALKQLHRDIVELNKYSKDLTNELGSLNTQIEESAKRAHEQNMADIRAFIDDVENAGEAYSRGQRKELDKSIGNFKTMINQGEEAFGFWSFSKMALFVLLLVILGFQMYNNHNFSQELKRVNNQIGMIHALYKGDVKYWFDSENQRMYIETQGQHNQRYK